MSSVNFGIAKRDKNWECYECKYPPKLSKEILPYPEPTTTGVLKQVTPIPPTYGSNKIPELTSQKSSELKTSTYGSQKNSEPTPGFQKISAYGITYGSKKQPEAQPSAHPSPKKVEVKSSTSGHQKKSEHTSGFQIKPKQRASAGSRKEYEQPTPGSEEKEEHTNVSLNKQDTCISTPSEPQEGVENIPSTSESQMKKSEPTPGTSGTPNYGPLTPSARLNKEEKFDDDDDDDVPEAIRYEMLRDHWLHWRKVIAGQAEANATEKMLENSMLPNLQNLSIQRQRVAAAKAAKKTERDKRKKSKSNVKDSVKTTSKTKKRTSTSPLGGPPSKMMLTSSGREVKCRIEPQFLSGEAMEESLESLDDNEEKKRRKKKNKKDKKSSKEKERKSGRDEKNAKRKDKDKSSSSHSHRQ